MRAIVKIVAFDGRVLITRFIDPEVSGRYGASIYVRCGAETVPSAKKGGAKKGGAAKKKSKRDRMLLCRTRCLILLLR